MAIAAIKGDRTLKFSQMWTRVVIRRNIVAATVLRGLSTQFETM